MTSTTIEEVFDLRDGTGGLHTILGLHEVHYDDQRRMCLRLNITDQLLNPHGTTHGGTLFALCDSAIGTYIASQKRWAVTLNSTINFFRPTASGNQLTATVNERKRGKTISTFLVEVYDEKKSHIADASFTMYFTSGL